MKKIAFIGLGNMGKPMAVNLLKAGFNLSVFDLNTDAQNELAALGAIATDSPTAASKEADIVITMLPAGEHVKAVYLEQGLLASLNAGTLVIDCSTIAAVDARTVAASAVAHGVRFLDAPVSGGTAGAAAGTLTFIVGGEVADFQAAEPILSAMGKNIFHAGTHGAGQVAKICNNMLLGILMAGTAEALHLGVQNGLDAKVLSDIMLQSSGRNWTLELYNPYPNVQQNVPSSRGYAGGFMSRLMLKDMNLAKQTAQAAQANTPMADQARTLYTAHSAQHGELDFSSILQWYQKA